MPEGIRINGKILAELRTVRCMSQDDLSNVCEVAGWPVPRALISEYERGKKSPTPQSLDAMRRALALTRSEMRALVETPSLDAATSNGTTDEEDGADRRTAGKLIAVGGLTAVLVPSASLERISAHGDRPVDVGLVTAHEDIADVLASLHHTGRSDVLFGIVAHHADQLWALMDRPTTTGADRRKLEAVTVGSHAQAGLLAFNAGNRPGARHYFALARDVAEDADDDTLRAQALGFSSLLHSSRTTGGYGGNTPRALRLMSEAAYSARHADPGTRAWVFGWLATDLAASGDERGFFEAIESAEQLSARPHKGDGRGFFARNYSRTRAGGDKQVTGNLGVGLVLLKRPEEATDTLASPLVREVRAPRYRIMVLTGLAAAHVLQREPERACKELCESLSLTVDSVYALGIERIRGVRARFLGPWNRLPVSSNLMND